ncbi:MAG TPA: polysaccharide deacetylase family protein [Candidatus Saccharimonadales bacterium]
MMIRQRKLSQKIAKALVSVFVLAVVFTPSLLSIRWAYGVLADQDPRKVTDVSPLNTRQVDKTAAPLAAFEEPVISVTFDDGWQSIYSSGLPILQKYGIRTTQYVMSGTFDNPSYMTVEQLRSMQQAGHEIGSHTIAHADLTMLDEKQLTEELKSSQDTLSKHFGPIRDFTSPYGAYNTRTLQEIGKYYRSQKNAEGDPSADALGNINAKNGFNAFNFKSFSVRRHTTLEDLRKLVEATRTNNGWLVLTYHQIDHKNELYSVSPEAFEQQMAYLSGLSIRSATVGQFLDGLMPRQKLEF